MVGTLDLHQYYSGCGVNLWLVCLWVGDASYGRLETIPFPEDGVTWLYVVPPLLLIILTKYGIPVSTTFLVLTIFSPSSLGSMLTKSMMGYAVAFFVAIIIYRLVMKNSRSILVKPAISNILRCGWPCNGYLRHFCGASG